MPSIDELRLIISQRNTSPRGVADDGNFFDSSSSNDQSSNVKSEKGTTASQSDIDTYSSEFIQDVMKIALTYTEYRGAMTIVPSDVAEALDTFASQQSTYNVDASENDDKFNQWTKDDDMDEENEEVEAMDVDIKVQDVEKIRSGIIKLQALFRGKQVRDREVLQYDSDSDDEYDEEANEERVNQMNLQNTSTPIFDSVFLPVDSISLSDDEFKYQIFLPLSNDEDTYPSSTINFCNNCIAIGDGINSADDGRFGREMIVMGMMKKATYAFLVSKLS